MDKNTIEIIGVTGIPEVRHGDDIAELIVSSADNQNCLIRENDIFVQYFCSILFFKNFFHKIVFLYLGQKVIFKSFSLQEARHEAQPQQ